MRGQHDLISPDDHSVLSLDCPTACGGSEAGYSKSLVPRLLLTTPRSLSLLVTPRLSVSPVPRIITSARSLPLCSPEHPHLPFNSHRPRGLLGFQRDSVVHPGHRSGQGYPLSTIRTPWTMSLVITLPRPLVPCSCTKWSCPVGRNKYLSFGSWCCLCNANAFSD